MLNGRGAWINSYRVPSLEQFADRVPHVDYLIISANDDDLLSFAQRLGEIGKPWLVSIFPYRASPLSSIDRLLTWLQMPGCVGAVLNMEEGGDWLNDTQGVVTSGIIEALTGFNVYACLDTRGERANDDYQRVCAERCIGVMPMLYPAAFEQAVEVAYAAVINQTMVTAWGWKPIMPVLQTYDNIGADAVALQVSFAQRFSSYSAYTLGHATDEEWTAFIAMAEPIPEPQIPGATQPSGDAALAIITDKILVPLAFGYPLVAQARLKLLYQLAARTLPAVGDWFNADGSIK
jgi:hypothetical protein